MHSTNIFLPFGAGITYCPGRRFARNEIKLLTMFLLSRFEFTLLEGPDYVPEPDGSRAGLGIFSPKIDAKVTVKKI